MKKIILLLSFVFTINGISNAQGWMSSMEDAKKLALAENKLIIIDFWAVWCGPCKRMDSESWYKQDVKDIAQNYVLVRLDYDSEKKLVKKYKVKGIPYIYIVDGNGEILYQQIGYMPKNQLKQILNKYALNTSFLKKDLLNYYSRPSYFASFRLGSKYLDYALYTDKELKRDIINLSNLYFSEAKKYLKSNDVKNKKGFIQKRELLSIQEKLILNAPNRALKLLKKIDSSDINKINESLYNLLNYTTFKLLKDENNAEKWHKNLSDISLKKAELIIKNNS